MNVLAALLERPGARRSDPLSMDDYLQMFSFQGNSYLAGLFHQTLQGDREEILNDFQSYVGGAYQSSGVVFAVELVRLLLFSEARFMYRRLRNGRPGDLFSTPEMDLLRNPWPGGTTGDLLARAILDADLAGNHFAVRREHPSGPRIKRLRPDWVTIMMGFDGDRNMADADAPIWDIDGEVTGYLYHPGGLLSNTDPIPLLAKEVAHFAPVPDPLANHRGMSWLTPVVREISADKAATNHKLKFFENGATPNMVISLDIADPERFNKWREIFESRHEGVHNAYRTLFLGGGADATVVGNNLQQLDFKVTQGAGETRIAMAGGVHPVILGASEGLAGSSLNAGNYAQARRRLADGTLRPLWRNIAGSYAGLVDIPGDAELWYDDRDIRFLQEDQKDAADIQRTHANTIRTLVDAGFTPESVIDAVTNDDLTLLEHTNLYSVQLQPAGSNGSTPAPANV